jgi:hypothetical protein
MDAHFEDAKRYYYVAIRDALLRSGDQFYSVEQVKNWVLQRHPNVLAGTSLLVKHDIFIKLCLADFIRNNWIDSVPDRFAPTFIKKNERLKHAPEADKKFLAICEKYDDLGPSAEQWIGDALASILRRYDQADLSELLWNTEPEVETDDKSIAPSAQMKDANDEETFPASDRFVALDDNSSKYSDALSALQELIEESGKIRVNDWPEKEGVIETLNGALNMLRAKYVNKESVLALVSSATKFIMAKFAEAPIAELAQRTWAVIKNLFL